MYVYFIVVLLYFFPVCWAEEKMKIPERCRKFPESLLIKRGKLDPRKYGRGSLDVQIRVAGEQWGAGIIINPSYVLTAAHVASQVLVAASYSEDNEISLKDASVAVATQSKNTEFVSFRIHQLKVHPKYKTHGEYPIYDAALLKLKDTIIFSKRVRPICLTANKKFYKPGLNATVIGWGKMEQGGNSTRRLKIVEVPIVDNEVCRKKLKMEKKYIGEFTVCAGGNKFEDACEGDSGGPLMIQDQCERWLLLGIVSWGKGCGKYSLPAVYARVENILQWIIDETKDAMSCDAVNYQRVEPNIAECGIPAYRYMKSGVAVRMLNYPWVVNVYYGRDFLGNGVLINSTVVLTSTTVVKPWGQSLKAKEFVVHLGTPAYHKNASDYLYDYAYVKEVIFHPMGSHRFDLCLLVLGVKMADTLMKFHPICFSNFKFKFEEGDQVDIQSYTGSFLFQFKAAYGRIRRFSRCKDVNPGGFYRNRSMCVVQTSKNILPKRFDSIWPESCQEEKAAIITSNVAGRHYLLGLVAIPPETCFTPRVFHNVNWALTWIRTITTMLDVA